MFSVAEALELVLGECRPLAPVEMPAIEAVDLTLAEEVASDIDSPPHDKSMVDGYAIRAADLVAGRADFEVVEEVTAGAVPAREIAAGQATRIMTGAPIPAGADAVVMIERGRESGPDRVELSDRPPSPGQNIMRRGTAFVRGTVVVPAGAKIRPLEVAVLCEVGRARVEVVPRPTVSILATGNELVPADRTPAAGQLRNTNGPMLAAAVAKAGGIANLMDIARDERDALAAAISSGLAADVLVLSGGVSAGVLDLVPGVLAELGVEQVFHKVDMKPGKPLWFGVRRRGAAGRQTLVFGLPGNPVSSLVCFELFVRPALARLAGRKDDPKVVPAALTQSFTQRGDRPTYYPARLEFTQGAFHVTPVAWKGSADLAGLVPANALAHFPAGERQFEAGEIVQAHPLG
jgi:molybdopterin molybdotransferase